TSRSFATWSELRSGGPRCRARARRHEHIREAQILAEAVADERRHRRVDHLHRTADVDLVAAHVGKVREHRLVNQTAAAGPDIARPGVRHHGHEMEVVVFALPAFGQLGHVEILGPAHAAIQPHGPAQAKPERILDDALDRREPGRTRCEENWPLAIAQREVAVRPFEAQVVADLHCVEHVAGETAARDAPHVQIERPVRIRRIREGKGAALSVVEHDVDVLAGREGDRAVAMPPVLAMMSKICWIWSLKTVPSAMNASVHATAATTSRARKRADDMPSAPAIGAAMTETPGTNLAAMSERPPQRVMSDSLCRTQESGE